MQNIRITLQGQKINFDQFVAYNDKTRAVGNMQVNARGDVIDSQGNVIEKRTAIMKQKFTGHTVSNKKQKPSRSKNRPSNINLDRNQQSQSSPTEEIQETQVTDTVQSNTNTRRIMQQTDKFQHFGPRSSDLRGSLASDIEIDLSEVTKPSDFRTLKRI
jgi:hypothetical protein